MKAAVFHGRLDVRIEDIPRPVPGSGEVLVRVESAGICGSDAAEYAHGPILIPTDTEGRPQQIALGHEYVGTAVEVGPGVTTIAPGSVVVSGAGISCGACKQCLAGRTNLCTSYHTTGLHQDGGLAEYVLVPETILFDATTSGLSFDTLALAQPMAIAVHALRRSGLKAGQDAVIVGAGGIGAFLTFAAASIGARAFVSDLDEERLKLARSLGAFATELAGQRSLAEQLQSHGMDPAVFFEVSGSRQAFESVLEAAEPGAVLVPIGLQKDPLDLPLMEWTLKEFTVVGTVAHVFSSDIPESVRLLASRVGDWSDVAPKVLPLSSLVGEGLMPIADGTSKLVKTLISPGSTSVRKANHARHEGNQKSAVGV